MMDEVSRGLDENIIVLGAGNILYSDDGAGIRVIECLNRDYEFSDNVIIVDGGVLGLSLLGVMAEADHLIVVDTVLNHGRPGDIHRLKKHEIPDRILAKNSLHQVDIIETLTLCKVLGHVPETTIIGIEPEDIASFSDSLTCRIASRLDDLTRAVLDEIVHAGGSYRLL